MTHSLAAFKALEDALGVEVSAQTVRLRILAHYGEQLESHSLHLGYLVAPDLLGRTSIIPLAASHPDLVRTVIAIHRTGNLIMEKLAGRKTHPVRLVPGGFAMLPTAADLRALQRELEATLPRLQALAEAVTGLAGGFPSFERDTEYVALVREPAYPYYQGEIGSSDTDETVPAGAFEGVIEEYVTPQSTAKWTRWYRESYMVGALARFNLNGAWLQPRARATARALGLSPGCRNPYLNNLAQVVECVQVTEHAL